LLTLDAGHVEGCCISVFVDCKIIKWKINYQQN